jgi:ribosomal protein L11 methyltransferase
MDNFWVVTLFHLQPSREQWVKIETEAMGHFESHGIEEFSLTEAEVDELLGDRSYSGGDLPIEVIDEVDRRVLAKPTNYRFFFGDVEKAKGFEAFARTHVLSEVQTTEHKTEDWNAEWKKHYSPILVNEHLEIIPSWETEYQTAAKEKIMIYPGQGFGTGSHETTFLCLKLFTEELLSMDIKTVLDFGSGSGILGLATFKFFPEAKVDFFDIDIEANKNCYQNAEINNLTDKKFRLLLPEVKTQIHEKYDLIYANILESILMEEKNFLLSRLAVGSNLILSGLLRHQMNNIVKLYSVSNMKLVRKVEKGDWGALLFRKER